MIHMRVIQGRELVADLPEWDGPVPSRGDYIFHPPQLGEASEPGDLFQVAGCVATVTWRLYERPSRRLAGEPTGFRQTHRPYVEIMLAS